MSSAPHEESINLVQSLQELAQSKGLKPEVLRVAMETAGGRRLVLPDRHAIAVSDGEQVFEWAVPSLAELFRGDRQPPADMDKYPPEYTPCFFFIEDHLLGLCEAIGPRTDQEMEEVYNALRRRPDGRSLGQTHDFMWQVCALLLGTRILSGAEFEALAGALLGSARRWGLRPVSRFYVEYLESELS